MGTRIRRVPAGWVPPVKEIKEDPKPEATPVKEKKTRTKKGVKKNESDS